MKAKDAFGKALAKPCKRQESGFRKSGFRPETLPEPRTLNPPLAQTGGFASPSLNNRLTEWWTLDFAAFRTELRKAFKVEIPVKERADWEAALAEWQRQHTDLTTRLIAIETDIDDRVCRLFNLTPADRRLLADHSRHATTDYPFGAV